jgi:methionyl-tRNA formyltransferase
VALRIAFFGLPLAALLLARDGHDVVLASVCRRDALGLRRLRRLLGDRVRVAPRADDPALAGEVERLAPDLVVSWFWTTKLPMRIVRAARLGGVGVHPSLLPRHRGPDPTYWAIASGDAETGVTAHRIERDYDTGAILAQERLAIDPAWNAWELARALDRPSLRVLRATVARFARGEPVPETPQDPALATEAPFPTDEACAIGWSWPTARVLRHVRALAPAPGAWTEIDDRLVVVTRAADAPRFPAALAPGEGVAQEGTAIVRTGDGAVALLEGEVDGEPADRERLAALFLHGPGFLVG